MNNMNKICYRRIAINRVLCVSVIVPNHDIIYSCFYLYVSCSKNGGVGIAEIVITLGRRALVTS